MPGGFGKFLAPGIQSGVRLLPGVDFFGGKQRGFPEGIFGKARGDCRHDEIVLPCFFRHAFSLLKILFGRRARNAFGDDLGNARERHGERDAPPHEIQRHFPADLPHDRVLVPFRDERERHRLFRFADAEIVEHLRMRRPQPFEAHGECHGDFVDDLF